MDYFTSDTHLGHKKIIEYCNRPFKDVYLMDKAIVENWNEVVSDDDTVYHLGDFAFGGIKNYLPHLNGNIILIRGNHDRDNDIRGCEDLKIVQNMDYVAGGLKFKLNHRPVFVPGTNDPFNDAERRSVIKLKDYDYIMCGHVHEKWVKLQKNINVGTDAWGFKPTSIDNLLEFIKS